MSREKSWSRREGVGATVVGTPLSVLCATGNSASLGGAEGRKGEASDGKRGERRTKGVLLGEREGERRIDRRRSLPRQSTTTEERTAKCGKCRLPGAGRGRRWTDCRRREEKEEESSPLIRGSRRREEGEDRPASVQAGERLTHLF